MKDNWFDNGLNEKLGSYGSSLDLEKTWKELESKRNPKSRKRFLWWWMVGWVMLCIAGITFSYFNNNVSSELAVSAQAKQEDNGSANLVGNNAKLLEVNDRDNEGIQQEQSTSAIQPPLAEQNIDFNLRSNALNKAFGDTSPNYVDSKRSQTSSRAVSRDLINITSQTLGNENTSRLNKSNLPPLEKNKTQSQETKEESIVSHLDDIFRYRGLLVKDSVGISFPKVDLTEEKDICPAIENQHSQFIGIAAGYGPGISGRIFSEEKPLEVVSLNLFYKKYLSKRLYLKSGINLDQYTTKVEGESVRTYSQLMDNQIVAVYHYQNGTTENVRDDAIVDVTETSNYEIFNRYQFLTIPMLVGYTIGQRKMSSFDIEVGLSTTIDSRHDIKYFDVSSPDKFLQVQNIDLKRRGIFSGLYGVQWNYFPQASTKLGLLVKYQGQMQLNDISKNADLNIQRFNAQKIFFGLQYRM